MGLQPGVPGLLRPVCHFILTKECTMRQAQTGSRLRNVQPRCVAVLVPAAWAYINGKCVSTWEPFEKRMQAGGWAMGAVRWQADCDVNEIIGKALQALPRKANRVSVEVKREIARLARAAIKTAASTRQEVIKKGQAGAVQYQLGVFKYEMYWETRGGHEEDRHTGLVPFVALKIADSDVLHEKK